MTRRIHPIFVLTTLFVLMMVLALPGRAAHAQTGPSTDEAGSPIGIQPIEAEPDGQTAKVPAAPAAEQLDLDDVEAQALDVRAPAEGAGTDADVGATDGGPATDGLLDTVYDSIDPCNDVDFWAFDAVAGQQVVITMNTTWGALDPFIELYNPYGELRAADDDSGGNRNARLAGVIGTTGRYTIRAHSFNYASVGGYALSVTLGSACSGCNPCAGCGGGSSPVTAEQLWFTDAYGYRRSVTSFRPGQTVQAHVVVRNSGSYGQGTTFSLDYENVWPCFYPPCPSQWQVARTGSATVSPGRWEMVMTTTADALRSNVLHYRMRVTAGGRTSTADYRE